MPILIMLTHPEQDRFPVVTLRVVTLLPRSKLVRRLAKGSCSCAFGILGCAEDAGASKQPNFLRR